MNQKQKIILIIFAIIDITVIGFLASTMIRTWLSFPTRRLQYVNSGCSSYFLDILHNKEDQITVSISENTIHLIISENINENTDDAILLWSLLDHLKQYIAEVMKYCPNSQTLIIQYKITQDNAIRNHISIVSVNDLYAWSTQTLSEENFAATIKYHQSASGNTGSE